MKDWIEIIKEEHGFNYGKLYVWLLETEMSMKAKIVWGVMDSFGSKSRAGNASICRRASCTRPTLRLAQEELIKNGWLELMREATATEPRQWLLKMPGVVKPLYQGGKATLPGVVKPLYPKQEDKQEQQENPNTTAEAVKTTLKHPDQDTAWRHLCSAWAVRFPGQALKWPTQMRGFQKILTEALVNLGAAELVRRWKICLDDKFSRPSLRMFFSDLDRWLEPRKDFAAIRQTSHQNYEAQKEADRKRTELARSLGLDKNNNPLKRIN